MSQGGGTKIKTPSAKTVKVGTLNPNLNPAMNIQAQQWHKLVLRYDVPAVLKKDRELVINELLKRYYGSPLRSTPEFWHFMKNNCPPDLADDYEVQGYNYWNMNFGNNQRIYVTFDFPGAGVIGEQLITFKP